MNMYTEGFNRIPKGIKYFLIISIAVHIMQHIPGLGQLLSNNASLIPVLVFRNGQIWRLITYIFLHGDPMHLLFNMLALWMFGVEIEERWGTKRFVVFYFISGVGAGLLSFFMWEASIIGASGAILALLTVYAYYYPNRKILMFFIFPVKVWIAVVIIGAISILMAGSGSNVAHLTHLGGIVVAIIYLRYYNQAISWNTHRRAVGAEKTMRKRAHNKISMDRHYEEVIDPILKKISEKGMGSLTKEEKKILAQASKKDQ